MQAIKKLGYFSTCVHRMTFQQLWQLLFGTISVISALLLSLTNLWEGFLASLQRHKPSPFVWNPLRRKIKHDMDFWRGCRSNGLCSSHTVQVYRRCCFATASASVAPLTQAFLIIFQRWQLNLHKLIGCLFSICLVERQLPVLELCSSFNSSKAT